MTLPWHKRYNWRIFFRNNRRALTISLVGFVLCLATLAWLAWAMKHYELQSVKFKLATLRADVMYVGTFGRWTPTDIREGGIVDDLRVK